MLLSRGFISYFIKVSLFTLLALYSSQITYAGNTVNVTRGPQFPATVINWNVVGGSVTCNGTTGYPTIDPPNGMTVTDGIKTDWTTGAPHAGSGSITWNNVYAPAGTYIFTCTDSLAPFASDFATMIVAGCSGATPDWNDVSGTCIAAPVITNFTLSPSSVAFGGSATLTWGTIGATSCQITPSNGAGIGAVAVNGSVGTGARVATVAFVLSCTNGISTVTNTKSLTVGAALPTIGTFTNNGPIPYNTPVTLSWTGITNATTCSIDHGIGAVSCANSSAVSGNLIASVTYTLTVTGPGGNASASTPVIVTPLNRPPTVPTITGPTTRDVNQDGIYGFTSTDPDLDTLHYEIDWDNNGTVDQTLPAGYVPSGTTMSQANNWASPGVKIFEGRAVDSKGATSLWRSYSVTASCTPGFFDNGGVCAPCTPGNYCAGPVPPVICPANTWCDGQNTPPGVLPKPPVPCPPFTFSPPGSVSALQCLPLPDLTASAITPTVAKKSVNTSFSAKVTNDGTGSTGGPFDNFIQWATGPNGGGVKTDLSPVNMATLLGKSSSTSSHTHTFNSNGIYSMRMCADKSNSGSLGVINESDEGNNCSAWTDITVTTCAPGEFDNAGSCTVCPPGDMCDGNTPPVACPPNTFCDGGNTPPAGTKPPVPCPPFTGSPSGSINLGACTPLTGSLIAVPSSCKIVTGASTCPVTLNWNTVGPIGISSITTNIPAPNTIIYNGNTGSKITNIPYDISGKIKYFLYNNAIEIASTTVDIACVAGVNNWDTVSKECANPQVGPVTVTGDYVVNPGSIDFTCLGSNKYEVLRDPAGANQNMSSGNYVGPVSSPAPSQDNYKVICKHGSVQASQTVFYHFPAPLSTISIEAYPKTISTEGASLLNWSITFPVAACTLSAKAVCANDSCSQEQLDAAGTLNGIIATGNTDANDPNGLRLIGAAVNTIAPGHEATDHKALGRKTFKIKKSTDFTLDCGAGKKATARVRVANSNEQ